MGGNKRGRERERYIHMTTAKNVHSAFYMGLLVEKVDRGRGKERERKMRSERERYRGEREKGREWEENIAKERGRERERDILTPAKNVQSSSIWLPCLKNWARINFEYPLCHFFKLTVIRLILEMIYMYDIHVYHFRDDIHYTCITLHVDDMHVG